MTGGRARSSKEAPGLVPNTSVGLLLGAIFTFVVTIVGVLIDKPYYIAIAATGLFLLLALLWLIIGLARSLERRTVFYIKKLEGKLEDHFQQEKQSQEAYLLQEQQQATHFQEEKQRFESHFEETKQRLEGYLHKMEQIGGEIAQIREKVDGLCEELETPDQMSWRYFWERVKLLQHQVEEDRFETDVVLSIGRAGAVVGAILAGNMGGKKHVAIDRIVDWSTGSRVVTIIPDLKVLSSFLVDKKVLCVMAECNTGETFIELKKELTEKVGWSDKFKRPYTE